jgi:acyl-CoA thioester hydrolase
MIVPAYAFAVTAAPEHIDELGHVNHKIYFAWAEEAGVRHWRSLASSGLQAQWVWVASRIEADFYRETLLGETLRVETWVGEPKGARFDRFVRIVGADGKVRAEVKTTWALIDAEKRRPARITGELAALFTAVG